jgi:DNA-binding transcriptional MerR regulator
MYRVQEFAALAGVTVRALHHYDQLGLLKPLRRPGSGYRIYRDADVARLEQIVVLKFLGIPLREIGPLLQGRGCTRTCTGRKAISPTPATGIGTPANRSSRARSKRSGARS